MKSFLRPGPKPIKLEGDEFKEVVVVEDVLMGRKPVGDKVVIIGGGLVGCETALWLAQQGKNVTVVEILGEILGGPHGMPFMNYQMLTELLRYHKVDIHTNTKVKEVRPNEAVLEKGTEVFTVPADTVIGATGYKEIMRFTMSCAIWSSGAQHRRFQRSPEHHVCHLGRL